MFGFFRMGSPGSLPGGPPFSEFEKFRQLVLLWSVEQASIGDGRGITGYELKNLFNVPQTTVYRALGDLESKGLVRAEESVVDGRAQKRYTLTSEGKDALDDLKKTVAGKITFLFEMLAPEMATLGKGHLVDHFVAFFKSRMKVAGSKEEALAILETFQEMHMHQEAMMQKARDMMKNYYDKLLQFKKSVEQMDEYDPDLLVELIEKEMRTSIEKE
ncbi:MAG: helix-turn-helix transcriptional regulator [Candidatus Lokiarchaeota archaeon]|nr:helix-turn-helix transcriptional regulator [Candidatus Lokiarchaeota archaeon]